MDQTCWPVSIKGVVRARDQNRDAVLLALNDRQEWELLGGRLERGEQPPLTVAREVREESGLTVTTGPLLDSWVYSITEHLQVLIVTYDCPLETAAPVSTSHEHQDVRWWPVDQLPSLDIPDGYVRSIHRAFRLEQSA